MDESLRILAFGLLIPVVAIVGGLIIAALGLHHRAKLRELAYRERIAMIEKGLVPPPETDPSRFERAMEGWDCAPADPAVTAQRHRAAGVITVGAGLGVMLLLYFVTGQERLAFGVGGATIVLGLAFLVTSLLYRGGPGK